MPPHCDTLDGPVVKAAIQALEAGNVDLVLPYVPREAELEVKTCFDSVSSARQEGDESREVADQLFFETIVRLHRAGEGEPFTGLKPAGLDHGPTIPIAERAIESGNPDELIDHLCKTVKERVESQLSTVITLKEGIENVDDIEANRKFVSAELGLQVWSHRIHGCVESAEHEALHHTRSNTNGNED